VTGLRPKVLLPAYDDAPDHEKKGRTTPVDVHVGSRIRLRRKMLGLSQTQLGSALGVTFQQLQKYEWGENRVAASRLFELAHVLDVPIAFFFDGQFDTSSSLAYEDFGLPAPPPTEVGEALPAGALDRRETLELIRAYQGIADPARRKMLLDLIRSLRTTNTD
jgi:transcriptional regulator with XRE-family HTH domain